MQSGQDAEAPSGCTTETSLRFAIASRWSTICGAQSTHVNSRCPVSSPHAGAVAGYGPVCRIPQVKGQHGVNDVMDYDRTEPDGVMFIPNDVVNGPAVLAAAPARRTRTAPLLGSPNFRAVSKSHTLKDTGLDTGVSAAVRETAPGPGQSLPAIHNNV